MIFWIIIQKIMMFFWISVFILLASLGRYFLAKGSKTFGSTVNRQRSMVIYFSHRLHRFSSYRLIGHGTLYPYILCVYRRPSMISRGRMPLTSKMTWWGFRYDGMSRSRNWLCATARMAASYCPCGN